MPVIIYLTFRLILRLYCLGYDLHTFQYFLIVLALLLCECAGGVLAAVWPRCLGLQNARGGAVGALQAYYALPDYEQFTAAVDLAQTEVTYKNPLGSSNSFLICLLYSPNIVTMGMANKRVDIYSGYRADTPHSLSSRCPCSWKEILYLSLAAFYTVLRGKTTYDVIPSSPFFSKTKRTGHPHTSKPIICCAT